MRKIKNNYYLYSGLFLFALVFSFFGFGKIHTARAAQCKISIVFDAKPNPVRFNQVVNLFGTISFAGSVFDPPGTPNAGYCYDVVDQPVKKLAVRVTMGQSGNIAYQDSELSVTPASSQPLQFSVSMIPSEKGFTAGQTLNAQAIVSNRASVTYKLTESFLTPVTLSQGVSATYGCVGDDGKYWCSGGNLSDCSDVPKRGQCADSKNCKQIADSLTMCGNLAERYACVAGNGNYACSQSGTKADCSDATGCNTASQQQCKKIDSSSCGKNAQASQATNSNNTSNASQSTAAATGDRTANCTGPNPDPNLCLINPLPTAALTDMLLRILRGFFMVVGIWAVAFVMIGGFRMIMAAGNEEQYTQAKKTIIWAIMGFVIAVMSFAIIAVVQNFIGAKNISESDVIKTK